MGTDRDVGQQRPAVMVQPVQRVKHRLQRLYAALRHDRAAGEAVLPLVHHHQPAEHQVTLDDRLLLDGPRYVVVVVAETHVVVLVGGVLILGVGEAVEGAVEVFVFQVGAVLAVVVVQLLRLEGVDDAEYADQVDG